MGSRLSEFESGTIGRPSRGLLIILLLAALPIILAAAVIIVGNRGDDVPAGSTSAVEAAAGEFFIEPFVEPYIGLSSRVQAALIASAVLADRKFSEPSRAALATPSEPADAYYTERYWKMAAEAATVEQSAIESGADLGGAVDAYYTEKYWKMAAASAASGADKAELLDGYAYYTERYWLMAAESQAAAPEEAVPVRSLRQAHRR